MQRTSACLQPKTIPLPACAILGIRPGYCIPTSWLTKKKSLPADLPEGTLVRTPLSKAVVYSSVHCGLLNQIGAFEKYWRSLRFEVYQNCKKCRMLPHRKHRRCREWNEPGYRKDNRPASRCHYALPFREQWRIRTGGKTQHPHYRMCRLHGNFGIGRAEWMRFYGLLFGEAQKRTVVAVGGKTE